MTYFVFTFITEERIILFVYCVGRGKSNSTSKTKEGRLECILGTHGKLEQGLIETFCWLVTYLPTVLQPSAPAHSTR